MKQATGRDRGRFQVAAGQWEPSPQGAKKKQVPSPRKGAKKRNPHRPRKGLKNAIPKSPHNFLFVFSLLKYPVKPLLRSTIM